MAMQLKEDLVRGAEIRTSPTSVQIDRVFMVYGIDKNDHNAMTTALSCPGLPIYGSTHPVMGMCVVRYFRVEPIKSDSSSTMFTTAVLVIVTYEAGVFNSIPGLPIINFGSSLMRVENDYYIDPATGTPTPILVNWSGSTVPEPALVQYDLRLDYISFEKWFVVKDTTFLAYPTPLETLKDRYFNHVNGPEWRGGKKHSWKCTELDGKTEDNGKSYTISVKIEHIPLPTGWDQFAFYRKGDGTVPKEALMADAIKGTKGPNQGDGVVLVNQLYPEADFTKLGQDLYDLPVQ